MVLVPPPPPPIAQLSCTYIWAPRDISFLCTLNPSEIYYELITYQYIIHGFIFLFQSRW